MNRRGAPKPVQHDHHVLRQRRQLVIDLRLVELRQARIERPKSHASRPRIDQPIVTNDGVLLNPPVVVDHLVRKREPPAPIVRRPQQPLGARAARHNHSPAQLATTRAKHARLYSSQLSHFRLRTEFNHRPFSPAARGGSGEHSTPIGSNAHYAGSPPRVRRAACPPISGKPAAPTTCGQPPHFRRGPASVARSANKRPPPHPVDP